MKRKGFTLVELLIVIVVIGVLSAMMMLSSTEAVSSAQAARVITAMTNLKKAVVAWYVDNHDNIVTDNEGYKIKTAKGKLEKLSDYIKNNKTAILKYLNNSDSIDFRSKREVENSNIDSYSDVYVFLDVKYKKWYIYYKVDSDSRLKAKLAGKAKSLGLYGLDGNSIKTEKNLMTNIIKNKKYYTDETFVCMLALSLADYTQDDLKDIK